MTMKVCANIATKELCCKRQQPPITLFTHIFPCVTEWILRYALEGIYIANIHIENACFEILGSVSFNFYHLTVIRGREINIRVLQ